MLLDLCISERNALAHLKLLILKKIRHTFYSHLFLKLKLQTVKEYSQKSLHDALHMIIFY